MATTKRGKKARAGGRGSKAARARSASGRTRTAAKGARKAGARRAGAARAAAGKRKKGKAAGGAAAALAQQKARFDRERAALEKRLTETVREIGQLRHHEMRATQLERKVAEQDQTIAALRRELTELRGRPPVARAAADQPSLDFGSEEVRADELDESVPLDDEDDDLI